MKKLLKSILAATIVSASALSAVGLTACGGSGDVGEKVSIAIGVQQTSGNNYTSMCNFLDSLKEELNFDYETVLLNSRNNDENLTTFQNKILGGVDGIISMVDMDIPNTTTLMSYCEQNEVYYAGYMSDFANTFNTTDNASATAIVNSKYMLGSVSDGETDGAVRGAYLFNQIVQTTARKIVFARFPLYAYPVAGTAITEFKRLAEEYNTTHSDKFTYYTADDATDGVFEVGFTMSTVPDATVTNWKNAGVEAVVAVNSLGKRLLTPVNNVNANIAIYQTGWDDSIIDSFPTTIKTLCQTPAETIIYPLIRILNAARGNSYSDEPTGKAKIVTGQYVYLSTAEDLANGRQNSMNFSEDHTVNHAIISTADVKALLASEGGTFKALTDTLAKWTTSYALTRK